MTDKQKNTMKKTAWNIIKDLEVDEEYQIVLFRRFCTSVNAGFVDIDCDIEGEILASY